MAERLTGREPVLMIRAITAFAAVAFVIVGSAAIALANAIIDTDIDLTDDDV